MENKNFINCSNCNLPIYPPKLPKGMNVKDRFDQIRCLGCNTINTYTQSQEYKFKLVEEKHSNSGRNKIGPSAKTVILIWIIVTVLTSDLTDLTVGWLIVAGVLTVMYFSRNILKRKYIEFLKYLDFLKKN